MDQLRGSPIKWHETEHELVLHIPPRAWRLFRPLLGTAAFFTLFVLGIAYASNGWLLGTIGMAAVPAILLYIAYAKMRDAYLTDALVTITPEQVTLKEVRRGHETVRKLKLKPRSRAWQWTPRQATSRSLESRPAGIVIAGPSYNPEAGDDPNDRSKPRFGGNLTPGEMDWVQWRVNLFLDRQGHARVSDSTDDDTPPAPQNTLVQINDAGFESRILFPNTVASRSFTGVWVLLIGVVLLTFSSVPLLIIWRDAEQMDWPQLLKMLVFLGLFGTLGLAGASNGLVQLFGKRQLTISTQKVRYSATVLGIGAWWTLSTADILSVWDPATRDATRRPNQDIASAASTEIRTARRQRPLRAVHDAVDSAAATRWLASEITRRIVAAQAESAV